MISLHITPANGSICHIYIQSCNRIDPKLTRYLPRGITRQAASTILSSSLFGLARAPIKCVYPASLIRAPRGRGFRFGIAVLSTALGLGRGVGGLGGAHAGACERGREIVGRFCLLLLDPILVGWFIGIF